MDMSPDNSDTGDQMDSAMDTSMSMEQTQDEALISNPDTQQNEQNQQQHQSSEPVDIKPQMPILAPTTSTSTATPADTSMDTSNTVPGAGANPTTSTSNENNDSNNPQANTDSTSTHANSKPQQPMGAHELLKEAIGASTSGGVDANKAATTTIFDTILNSANIPSSSIPDEVVHHFLNTAGLHTTDERVTRLIAVAAQKFVHDIVSDSLQHCKLRGAQGKKTKEKKYTLTLEDLASALSEYGIDVKRQHYFN